MILLTSKEAADLEQVTERSIQLWVKAGKLQGAQRSIGKGRGGQTYQIPLNCLSQAAQDRYHGKQQEEQRDILLSLTDAQREEAYKKEGIVSDYQDFKAMYPKADKMKAFLMQYNEQHPDKPLTKRQLNHWETLFNRDGFVGLVDRRGGYNKGTSSIPKEIQDAFLAYWLQEKGTRAGGPSVKSCYRMTQYNFPDQQLPSVDTFERFANSLPYPVKVRYREGQKAFDDKCMPHIPFDYSSIHTNQQWVADNHIFDVLVKDSTGRVFRPWIIGWMDRRSRYITGYLMLHTDPNSDAIIDAFAVAVLDCGIPEGVLLDNGKDYTVHDLFNQRFMMSLANEMNLSVTNAIKYNAKAKPIERFFRTLEYSYCIHLPSYIGSDPKKRPEALKKLNTKLVDAAIPYDDFQQFIANIIAQYNNTPHSGDGMNGRTPCQAFAECVTIPIRTADPIMLSMYFKRTTKLLKVGRNGVRVPQLQQYYDAKELFERQGQQIYVRYNTSDVRQVYCLTEEGEFICMATNITLGTLDKELTAQNMRQLNNVKKARRETIKAFMPDVAVPSIEQIAIEMGHTFDKPNLKLLPTMSTVNSTQHRQARAMLEADAQLQQDREMAQVAKNGTLLDEDEAYFKHMVGG